METRSAVRVWVALLFCVGQWLVTSAPAQAEPIDAARSASARALFEEGVAHADHEAWAPAADAFRRALSLRDSQVIRYNLASALVELGKLVEASELLNIVQAESQVDASLKQQAVDKQSELKPRIAHLTIHVEPMLPDVIVELDDAALTLAELQVPLAVDPGKHVVRARLADAVVDEQSAELPEGASALLHLHPPEPKPEPVVVAAPVPAPASVFTPVETARLAVAEPAAAPSAPLPLRDSAPEKPSRKKLWWGLAVGGVGVVAFVTLVTLLVPRQHSRSSAASGDFDPPSVSVRVPQ